MEQLPRIALNNLMAIGVSLDRIAAALESAAGHGSVTSPKPRKRQRRPARRRAVVIDGIEPDELSMAKARRVLRDLGLKQS